MSDLVERLRAACVGRPAKIAWPHRILHEAADEIEKCWGNINTKADWIEATINDMSSTDASLSALQEQNKAIRAALENVMGHLDTPIARRRLGISDPHPEWLTSARAALEANKQEGGE